jgi:hypothetical protein
MLDDSKGTSDRRSSRRPTPPAPVAVRRSPGHRRRPVKTFLRRAWFEVLNFAEGYKLQTLAAVFFWMFIVWIVGTNLIWLCEQCLPPGELRDQSPYVGPRKYFDTYWWVINAIMSAGVEDAATPQSVGARTVAVLVVLIGVCLVTVFTGNVVAVLWERIARRELLRIKPRIAHVAQYSGHIVIANASAKFEPVLRQIVDKVGRDTRIVLVDPKADQYRTDRRPLFRTTFAVTGNPQSLRVLRQADVQTASALVILTPEVPNASLQERDYQALITALAVQPIAESNPELRIILEVNLERTTAFVEIFNALDNYPLRIEAVCAEDFQEKLLSQACLTPGLSHFFDLLLTVPPRSRRRSPITRFFDAILLREVEVEEATPGVADMANDVRAIPLPEELVGRTFRQVRQAVDEIDGVTVIGYLRWESDGGGLGVRKPAVTLNPSRKPPAPGQPAPADYRLAQNDQLFVIVRDPSLRRLGPKTRRARKADAGRGEPLMPSGGRNHGQPIR